jgi:hypothetical protein
LGHFQCTKGERGVINSIARSLRDCSLFSFFASGPVLAIVCHARQAATLAMGGTDGFIAISAKISFGSKVSGSKTKGTCQGKSPDILPTAPFGTGPFSLQA